jgi:hypothetical protein
MKEINQRNKNELLFRCNCGSDHFLNFYYDIDDFEWNDNDERTKENLWKEYYICFIEKQEKDFLSRIKECWKYLFKKKNAELCYSGIGLTSEDMNKIIEHFQKYQAL